MNAVSQHLGILEYSPRISHDLKRIKPPLMKGWVAFPRAALDSRGPRKDAWPQYNQTQRILGIDPRMD